MQVTPPAGQSAPSAPPASGGGQMGPAEQAIKLIQQGFQQLAKMMQAAGDKIPPDDMKLFQNAVQSVDAFIQALMGDAQGAEAPDGDQAPAPKGNPMPAHANSGAKPAPQY